MILISIKKEQRCKVGRSVRRLRLNKEEKPYITVDAMMSTKKEMDDTSVKSKKSSIF